MGARQKEWARRTRERLLTELGAACAWCGRKEGQADEHGRETKLSFDCIVPLRVGQTTEHKHEHHRRMDWSCRMSFYRQQHKCGNLQVLCVRCNSSKGNRITFHETEEFDLPPLTVAQGNPF